MRQSGNHFETRIVLNLPLPDGSAACKHVNQKCRALLVPTGRAHLVSAWPGLAGANRGDRRHPLARPRDSTAAPRVRLLACAKDLSAALPNARRCSVGAQHRAGIHDALRVQRRLDGAHCRQFPGVAETLQILDLHPPDTMFSRNRPPERVHHVMYRRLDHRAQSLGPAPLPRCGKNVVVQIAIADTGQSNSPGTHPRPPPPPRRGR